MKKLIVKICGMREAENIRAIEPLADWMGFIFAPRSPRFVNEKPAYLPTDCQRVGVFVNADAEDILRHVTDYELNIVQLHGKESPELCKQLKAKGLTVIKVFQIADKSDLSATKKYEAVCDYFLFDTKCTTDGGSGKQFNWSVLNFYDGQTPFILSGGIGIDSVDALKQFHHPRWKGIDLNSRFETEPALKDTETIRIFLNKLTN